MAHDERALLKLWLLDRLRGPRGQADWCRLLEAGWSTILDRRVGELLPRPVIERLIDAHLTPERLSMLARPWAGAILQDAVADMRADAEPISRWVPAEAQALLEKIASRPGALDPEWIHAMFKERAVEVVLADTLYATMRDFSTLLPKMVMGLLPKGPFGVIGGAAGLGTKLMEELERRLEPEIKSFLAGGTKRALQQAASFTVAHLDDPVSREFRRNFVRFALSRSPEFHARALDAQVIEDVPQLVDYIARHLATHPETKEVVRRSLDRFVATYGEHTTREALKIVGFDTRPPLDAWASASWSVIAASLEGEEVRLWLGGLLDELLDEWDERRTTAAATVE